MQVKKFTDTLLVRLDPGEEIISALKKVAEERAVKLASVTGIGAINYAVIGLFDPVTKEYKQNVLPFNLEMVSLAGNISTMAGLPYLHLHLTAADEQSKVYGGHLNKAIVSATAEIFLHLLDGQIDREFSEKIGLNIIRF